jgi:hypothetical protein
MGHRLGQSVEGRFHIRIGHRFGTFLGDLQSFRSGNLKLRGKIDTENEFKLFVFFKIGFLNRRIVHQMKLLFFHGMMQAIAQESVFEFGLDIVGEAAADHFEGGMPGAKSREAGRFLDGEGHLFFREADLIGGDFPFEATAATAHIF